MTFREIRHSRGGVDWVFPLALRLYYSVVFVGREVYEWQVVRFGWVAK